MSTRLIGLGLVLAVLALHGCVVDQVATTVAGWSSPFARPSPIQVAYVRELSPTAPVPLPSTAPGAIPPGVAPTPTPPPAAPRAPRAATPAASAASAAADATAVTAAPVDEAASVASSAGAPGPDRPEADMPSPRVEPPATDPSTATATASATASATATATATASPPVEPPTSPAPATTALAESPTSAVAVAAAASEAAAAFQWPASTRLSYRLTGQYRGEVHGSATVEWVRALPRYEVRLDVVVGLPVAPLFTRRMRSEGRLGPQGLQPERYTEESKLAFRSPRVAELRVGDDQVQLANGQVWTRPAPAPAPDANADAAPRTTHLGRGVQDSASQFVQLSHLFTMDPSRLRPGSLIGFPLALPRRVEPWFYEVLTQQTVNTPFGPVEAFHVRPRRGTVRGNDLLAEAWFSPQLAYLPVRIRIEQDAEVFIDLMIDRKPELAAQ